MIIRVCYFTEAGKELAEKLKQDADFLVSVKEENELLSTWVKEGFEKHLPMLFIGACGIAVRSIAPHIQDKTTDSAVLVTDEKGKHVIPILSGHLGGSNAWAIRLSEILQAEPVLTTATDVEQVFSVDSFAVKNGLQIVNRDGIKQISAKVLQRKKITVAIAPEIALPAEKPIEELEIVPFESDSCDVRIVTEERYKTADYTDTLVMYVKEYVCGVGCRKGKTEEELLDFLTKQCQLDLTDRLYAFASIDLKKKEEGLCVLAAHYKVPFITFPSETLKAVQGDFDESSFVEQVTGVNNVCERAAVCAAGEDAVLVQRKTAKDGMTFAIAKRLPVLQTWDSHY